MQRLRFLLLSILLLAAPAAAVAADAALPQADPPGEWRVMTHDDATTTSRCIGQTKTISCSIDTHWACRIRGDRKLCDMAWNPAVVEALHPSAAGRGVYDIYRIEGMARYPGGDPLATVAQLTHNLNIRFYKPDAQKNDIFVAIYFDTCFNPDQASCIADVEHEIRDNGQPPTIFILSHTTGKGWRIKGYATPQW